MANSHVLKLTPSTEAERKFRRLPTTYLNYEYSKSSQIRKVSFTLDEHDNLPDRCESIAHSVIDHLKMQEYEEKGSPVSPTDNQIALLLFMLSHYITDAHMPFHCDNRRFSEGIDLHGYIESRWKDMVRRHYCIDEDNERFFYNPYGYPLRDSSRDEDYQSSFLQIVDTVLRDRKFIISLGTGNKNVWDFMSSICQYPYLLSYCLIPQEYDHTSVTFENWRSLGSISFEDFSATVFSDAIDSIARAWFRIWRRYMKWERKQRIEK